MGGKEIGIGLIGAGARSAMAALGLDEVQRNGRVVELEPTWKRQGIARKESEA
jgi:hypothetical protein